MLLFDITTSRIGVNMKKEIYLVPYSHLDTQWRWEYPTTINKYLKNTMEESFTLFDKYPEHTFNFTGALRYQMMKDYFPKDFERVKSLIQDNRWHLAGTCLDETDALVPSVESSIRNILYGDRWQKEHFGKTSKDYMIPDCFGFPENLPSVMSHCSIHGFSSNKLTWGSAVGIPFEIGKWVGPDDNEVISVFNPCRYDDHLTLPIFMNPGRLKRLNTIGEKSNVWKSFQYYGVGDIGGAPFEGSVKRAIKSINYYKNKNSDIEVKQGSADGFFESITAEEKSKMDAYSGDFLLINHSAGTLTSAVIMKRWNRKNEQMAFAAEAASVMAEQLTGLEYPNKAIKNAWQRIIGSQMHDILPGTSTPTAYEYSQNDEALALNTWTGIIEDAAKALNPLISGTGDILLFNPTEYHRRDNVEITYPIDSSKTYQLLDHLKNEHVVQTTENKILFKPHLKPFEWKRFELIETQIKVKEEVSLMKTDAWYLENEFVKVKIDFNGQLSSIRNKLLGKELLSDSMGYELQKERPMKFPAWNMDWRDRKKKPYIRLEGGEVEVIEDGPLKKTLMITLKHQKSIFKKEISLSENSHIVEFKERINWFETGCSLKLSLKTSMEDPKVTYNWETSRKSRDVNRKDQFEVPSRLWVDVSEKDYGFSIVEDSKYGYDRPDKSTLRMTLIYTPALRYVNGFWDQKSHDWGENTIKYGIVCHSGSYENTDTLARLFNQPVQAFKVSESDHDRSLDQFMTIESDQVGLLTVKKPEDSDGILIRLYEKHGRKVSSHMTFYSEILEAYEVDGLEERIGKAVYNDNQLTIDVQSNGIKSYIVKLKPEKTLEVKQTSVSLPYNYQLFSRNNETSTGIFPSEFKEDQISVGPVNFKTSELPILNGLTCLKQTIQIPEGYKKMSILVGAYTTQDVSFDFLNEQGDLLSSQPVQVQSSTGFIAQWESRTWKKTPKHHHKLKRDYAWLNKCTGVTPGYVNRDRVAWYSTHTHKNGKDLAYQYGYLYLKEMMIPDGADQVILPKNGDVFIVSMTVSNDTSVKSIKHLNDKYDY